MKTILVVDDEPKIVQVARDYLEHAGFAVLAAFDGQAGLAGARSKPDLIILDVHLPDLNGFELCSQVRTMALHAETPIFFVTGDASLENRAKSSLRGGNEFIAKPFTIQEIALKALKSVITSQVKPR